jgi:hypothetical protein
MGHKYKGALRRRDQHMTTSHGDPVPKKRFSKKFAEVMSARNIDDITLKMKAIQNVPQATLTRTFIEMCDVAINIYIQEQKKRYPGKSNQDIMQEYHLAHINPPPE